MDLLRRIIRFLLILVGAVVLLYPSVSEYLSEKNSSRAVAAYTEKTELLSEEEIAAIFAEAEAYNRLLGSGRSEDPSFTDRNGAVLSLDSYPVVLDPWDNGMMGYISIPKLRQTIPIYHGTEEAVMQVGIGHLENTSFPVGGASTHAVVSGHRGLPSKSLFTDLDQMKAGDRFFIQILNRKLCYTVDSIQVVLPYDMSSLAVEKGEDYVTLVTCTPYGINSHRLLVRGIRTPYEEKSETEEIPEEVIDDRPIWERMPVQYRHLAVGLAVIILVLFLRAVAAFISFIKRRRS